jgi:hypothetical protein
MSSTLLHKVWAIGILFFATASAAQVSLSCWDNLEKQTGYRLHTKKTPVVSNGKGWEAYVEMEARPARLESGSCVNTSRLMVRSARGKTFQAVYITRPSPYMLGNDLQILGWNGESLLFNDWGWQYASDHDSNQVVIFDATSGTFEAPDLGKMVAEKLQIPCDLRSVAKKWEGGQIYFEVSETELGEVDGCLQGKPKAWLYDRHGGTVKPAEEAAAFGAPSRFLAALRMTMRRESWSET